jgi:hypothetical protein
MSAAAVAVVRTATRVEVFRVASEPRELPLGDHVQHYPVLFTGKEQDRAFAARLSAILLGDGVTQMRKECGLEPSVAFRLWKGEDSVEVLVSFSCNLLWPHMVGAIAQDQVAEYQDFDSARAELVALVKEALPDDSEIQSLTVESPVQQP